jgi:hypothetical protein
MPDDPTQIQTPGQMLAGQPQTQPQQVGNTPLATRLAQDPSTPPPAQQQPPQQQSQPTPQQAVAEKHHALGKVTRFLFGASVDPTTGEPVPQKPGAIFRSLLAGALLGGAIGSEGHASGGSVGGFLSGVARGGNAVQDQIHQRQQEAQQRAQQQRQLSVDEQRAQDEHQLHQATVAHLTAETTSFHHLQEKQDQEAVDKKNAAAIAYMKILDDDGATRAQIPIDGKVSPTREYAASDIAAAFLKDPTILWGPPGTVRHFVDLHNASDIDYVDGKGWVDASGDPVDMSKTTVVRAYDVPENLYKKRIHHTGKELNTLAGYQLIPTEQEGNEFNMTLDAVTGLYAQNLKNLNAQAQAKQRAADAAKANAQANKAGTVKRGTPAQFAQVEAKKAQALAKAETAFENGGSIADLERAKAAAQKAYEDELQALGGSVTPVGGRTSSGRVGQVQVTDPRGVIHTFPDQKSADRFKKLAGIQ